jgi:hypothetical protein
VLEVESEPSRFDGPALDPGDPVIEITSSVTTLAVFQGQGQRAFAALSFEYETSLLVPGEPTTLLVPKLTVLPPDNLSIRRLSFDGEKPRALGSSGDAMLDRMDDGMVYTKQAETAATAAGAKLARALRAP